jgi:hypothetical protein
MKRVWTFLGKAAGYLIVAFLSALLSAWLVLALAGYFKTPLPIAPSVQTTSASTGDSLAMIEGISRLAIEASSRSLTIFQWSITAFVISLMGVAVSVTGKFSRDLKEAREDQARLQKQYEMVSRDLETTHKEYASITSKYQDLQLDFLSMEAQTMRMDVAGEAYEEGKITRERYLEVQAWHAWQKWKFGRDATGYEELSFLKEELKGLPMPVVRSAIAELSALQSKLLQPGMATKVDTETVEKLKALLNIG